MSWSALAIDQSMTSTGWAHTRRGQKAPTWGVRSSPHWGDEEGRHLWEWFEWLGKKATELEVTHLWVENTFTPSHHESLTEKIAQYGLIGQAAIVAFLLTQRGQAVEFGAISTGEWRPKFIGSGKAPAGLVKHQRRKWLKDKAVEACHVRGWLVEGSDAADALGILSFGCSQIDPEFAVRQGPLFRRAELNFENEQRAMK